MHFNIGAEENQFMNFMLVKMFMKGKIHICKILQNIKHSPNNILGVLGEIFSKCNEYDFLMLI